MAAMAAEPRFRQRNGEADARERPPRQTSGEVTGAQGPRQPHQLALSGAHLSRRRAGDRGRGVGRFAAMSGAIAWWWSIPATLAAIVVIGASQHQFGGAIHEGTHFMLFANRTAQRAGVRLARRLPDPDDDLSLPAAPSGAPPVRQRSRARSRYQPAAREPSLARLPDHARRDAVGALEAAVAAQSLPLHHHARPLQLAWAAATTRTPIPTGRAPSARCAPASCSRWARPAVVIPLIVMGNWLAVAIVLPVMWAAVVTILWTLPAAAYPGTRLAPVTPIRWLGISRVTYLALLYGALSAVQLAGWGRRGPTSASCGWCRCSRPSRCS